MRRQVQGRSSQVDGTADAAHAEPDAAEAAHVEPEAAADAEAAPADQPAPGEGEPETAPALGGTHWHSMTLPELVRSTRETAVKSLSRATPTGLHQPKLRILESFLDIPKTI